MRAGMGTSLTWTGVGTYRNTYGMAVLCLDWEERGGAPFPPWEQKCIALKASKLRVRGSLEKQPGPVQSQGAIVAPTTSCVEVQVRGQTSLGEQAMKRSLSWTL